MYSEKSPSEVMGPRRLRALAHPVRLDLLQLLSEEGSLTASDAAERLGLTPKTCSYHLGLLGRYGLAEETGEGKGRARPWRIVPTDLGYSPSSDDDPETARTQDEFARAVLDRDGRIVREFIDRRHRLPYAWRGLSKMSSTPLRLTADQLAGLRDELSEVIDRYQQAARDTQPGAVPVHAAVYAVLSDVGAVPQEDS
ncbi:helix-turn-helix domain-containing protein [Nocardiopsis nanhaiensis]